MLPNRMQLNRTVEDQLKKLKNQTGITPNIAARIAFFRSIETNYVFHAGNNYKLDGSMVLDKHTWLGKTQMIVELLLKNKYPELSYRDLQLAWASHVENGISSIRNHKSATDILGNL